MNNKPMLNVYPDSLGGKLSDIAELLQSQEMKDCFSSAYILPSLFHYDMDRGFSLVDYDLNENLANCEDLEKIKSLGIQLKLDFVLNHASTQSPQFKDVIQKGEESEYKDFFIHWNEFWDGYGTMTEEGYIQPDPEYIEKMFFRKPGLPLLMVGSVPFWNTFYQEVKEEKGEKKYLGQMDLNIKSAKVWEFYKETIEKLASYGAKLIRLDAFAYASKEPGRKNFFNEPETWELLEKVQALADECMNDESVACEKTELLPEIHASYEEKIYEQIAKKGYMTYDFFLPGLIIDALENHDGSMLKAWADEVIEKKIKTVNMLGCHDGIPLLDLKGLVPEERIHTLIEKIVGRGGIIKDLKGAQKNKNLYYQVNATYFSALGEDEKKMLAARALQMFMPGKPQVWYLDLFAGKNDYAAVNQNAAAHKEINRTNLSRKQVAEGLNMPVVQKQLELLRLRNTNPAFSYDSEINVSCKDDEMTFEWTHEEAHAALEINLRTYDFKIIQ